MIIETIVSTMDNEEKVNFSPFGIKKKKNQICISPYIPSKTLLNLELTKCAVVNYTDSTSFFVDCNDVAQMAVYNKPDLTIERNYTLFGRHDTRKAWPTQLSMILCTFSMSKNFR